MLSLVGHEDPRWGHSSFCRCHVTTAVICTSNFFPVSPATRALQRTEKSPDHFQGRNTRLGTGSSLNQSTTSTAQQDMQQAAGHKQKPTDTAVLLQFKQLLPLELTWGKSNRASKPEAIYYFVLVGWRTIKDWTNPFILWQWTQLWSPGFLEANASALQADPWTKQQIPPLPTLPHVFC